jgi:hypothetical protein
MHFEKFPIWKRPSGQTPQKFYLDTGIIYGYFKELIRHNRSGRPIEEFHKNFPDVCKTLIERRDKVLYIVSTLTKAQIYRHLHTDYQMSQDECRKIWETFKEEFNVIEIFINYPINFEEISYFLSKIKFDKSGIEDLIHLMIAKKEGLCFLTSEEEGKESFHKIYKNIMSYSRFKSLIII